MFILLCYKWTIIDCFQTGFEGSTTLLFELPGAPFPGRKSGVSWSWPFTVMYNADIENEWIPPSILHSPSWNAQSQPYFILDCVRNMVAQAQKPDFVFRRNGRVHLNRRGCQFSRLLAAEVCASAVVMLDTPRSEVVWRVLATHCIRQFPLHFPSRASTCAITFQLDYT